MSKKYIIRQINFMYNDELMYVVKGSGKFLKEFNDKEKAIGELLSLERRELSGLRVEEFEPISNCCRGKEFKLALEKYLQSEFGLTMIEENSDIGEPMVNMDFTLPNNLTVQQTREIREASGIKFYRLIEYIDGTPNFWGLQHGKLSDQHGEWLKYDAFRMENENYVNKEIPKIYGSRLEAEEDIQDSLYSVINNKVFHGSLEELSEVPTLLRKFIADNKEVTYDPESKELRLGYLHYEKHHIFHELLKDKLVEAKEFPNEKAAEYTEGWYPAM